MDDREKLKETLQYLKELRKVLVDCVEGINAWGAYADIYYQKKHHLLGG